MAPYRYWKYFWKCFDNKRITSPDSKKNKELVHLLKQQQSQFHSTILMKGMVREGLVSKEEYDIHKFALLESLTASKPSDSPELTRSKLLFLQDLLQEGCIDDSEYHKTKRPILHRLAELDAVLDVRDFILTPSEYFRMSLSHSIKKNRNIFSKSYRKSQSKGMKRLMGSIVKEREYGMSDKKRKEEKKGLLGLMSDGGEAKQNVVGMVERGEKLGKGGWEMRGEGGEEREKEGEGENPFQHPMYGVTRMVSGGTSEREIMEFSKKEGKEIEIEIEKEKEKEKEKENEKKKEMEKEKEKEKVKEIEKEKEEEDKEKKGFVSPSLHYSPAPIINESKPLINLPPPPHLPFTLFTPAPVAAVGNNMDTETKTNNFTGNIMRNLFGRMMEPKTAGSETGPSRTRTEALKTQTMDEKSETFKNSMVKSAMSIGSMLSESENPISEPDSEPNPFYSVNKGKKSDANLYGGGSDVIEEGKEKMNEKGKMSMRDESMDFDDKYEDNRGMSKVKYFPYSSNRRDMEKQKEKGKEIGKLVGIEENGKEKEKVMEIEKMMRKNDDLELVRKQTNAIIQTQLNGAMNVIQMVEGEEDEERGNGGEEYANGKKAVTANVKSKEGSKIMISEDEKKKFNPASAPISPSPQPLLKASFNVGKEKDGLVVSKDLNSIRTWLFKPPKKLQTQTSMDESKDEEEEEEEAEGEEVEKGKGKGKEVTEKLDDSVMGFGLVQTKTKLEVYEEEDVGLGVNGKMVGGRGKKKEEGRSGLRRKEAVNEKNRNSLCELSPNEIRTKQNKTNQVKSYSLSESIQTQLYCLREEICKNNSILPSKVLSNDQICAIAIRMPADKAELQKFFPRDWIELYGSSILSIVQNEVKKHVLSHSSALNDLVRTKPNERSNHSPIKTNPKQSHLNDARKKKTEAKTKPNTILDSDSTFNLNSNSNLLSGSELSKPEAWEQNSIGNRLNEDITKVKGKDKEEYSTSGLNVNVNGRYGNGKEKNLNDPDLVNERYEKEDGSKRRYGYRGRERDMEKEKEKGKEKEREGRGLENGRYGSDRSRSPLSRAPFITERYDSHSPNRVVRGYDGGSDRRKYVSRRSIPKADLSGSEEICITQTQDSNDDDFLSHVIDSRVEVGKEMKVNGEEEYQREMRNMSERERRDAARRALKKHADGVPMRSVMASKKIMNLNAKLNLTSGTVRGTEQRRDVSPNLLNKLEEKARDMYAGLELNKNEVQVGNKPVMEESEGSGWGSARKPARKKMLARRDLGDESNEAVVQVRGKGVGGNKVGSGKVKTGMRRNPRGQEGYELNKLR